MILLKTELEGGGKLLSIRTDKFKNETLSATLTFPMEQRKTRLCRLLFSMLKRGCRAYPDISALSRALDDLYDANLETMCAPTGEKVAAGFVLECLDGKYAGGEDLLGGASNILLRMISDPVLDESGLFPERAFNVEKRNLCDSIRASDNDPRIHSYQLCRSIMFEGEPYGLRAIGGVADVNSVSNREIADFRREYLSMSAPVFVYVGRRSPGEISELIADSFSAFGNKNKDIELGETVLRTASTNMRSVEEEMAVIQGKLTVGFRSDVGPTDPDFYGAMFVNDIFGGSAASKLFRNVREAQSLCYSCSSSYESAKGSIFVRSGIANENKDRVISEILSQFEDIKKGNISDYELECSKRSLVNYYRQAEDSPYSLESFYRSRLMLGSDITLAETVNRIEQVTREDIVRAAGRFGADTCAFVRGSLSGIDMGEGEYDED